MAITKIVILGGGVAGLAAALALRRLQPQLPGLNVNVSIYEIRDSPSTIGGAINLTPNALRYLEHLGVLPKLSPRGCPVESIELFSQRTGRKLGELCFEATDQHKYGALRVQRGELLAAMLETAQESGVDVRYGKKAIEISLDDEGATICFQDGESAVADLLLGCDGIHSFTRSVIEPSRNPEYSGIATAYGLFDDDGTVGKQIPFISTGLWSGRRGSLMSSWTNPQKSKLYVAAVMETAEVASREGWKVKSTDHRAVKDDILNRFRNSSVPVLEVAIEGVENFFLYPVYKLPPHGQWSRGPALLLGDAAHAMPPQGESVGLAIEDAVLFARIFEKFFDSPASEINKRFEKLRAPRINAAFDEANFRWENVRDKGFIASVMTEWMTSMYLWWMQEAKIKDFQYDVRELDLDA